MLLSTDQSTWFQIERGCRQGDPLSPYTLCAEILAIRIRQSSGVTGIKIKDVEYLISLLQTIHQFIWMAAENHLTPTDVRFVKLKRKQ